MALKVIEGHSHESAMNALEAFICSVFNAPYRLKKNVCTPKPQASKHFQEAKCSEMVEPNLQNMGDWSTLS